MLERNILTTFLHKIEVKIAVKHKSIKYYLFGSSLTNDQPSDVDLLIVYDEKNISIMKVLNLRRKLQSSFMFEFNKKLDVILFSNTEDSCNNFRHREKADYIYG